MGLILVVDDERDIANVLKMWLDRNGFEADVAYNPSSAMEQFREHQYNVVLIDIMMPEMDGYALYSKMLEVNSDIKACFMTGFDIPYLNILKQTQFYNENISIIRKPITPDELVRVLKVDLATV